MGEPALAPGVAFDPFGGHSVVVRPARPDDLVAVGSMLTRLSPASARLRFFSAPHPPRVRLVRPLVEVDHETHETLVALCGESAIGMAEYVRHDDDPSTAEVAVVVEDAYQQWGVATALFRNLGRLARERGVKEFTAVVLPDNRAAVKLVRSLSPGAQLAWNDGELRMRIPIPDATPPPRRGGSDRRVPTVEMPSLGAAGDR